MAAPMKWVRVGKIVEKILRFTAFRGRPGVLSVNTLSNTEGKHDASGLTAVHFSALSKKCSESLRPCPASSTQYRWQHGGQPPTDYNKDDESQIIPLRLMDFRERIWPHPLKMLRNMFLGLLIRGYIDPHFIVKDFLKGAEQAVQAISLQVSKGNFEALEGLIARDAIQEVRHHYQQLTSKQQAFISVDPDDFFSRFIYEIGMIFDDQNESRFVEVTAVFHGIHGRHLLSSAEEQQPLHKLHANTYICNYRFIREYTKGKEQDTQWTVNVLNHFLPKDVVQSSGFFSR